MALPRSPAGLLAAQLTDEPMARSSSALSSSSASPSTHPALLRRRSTDTSGGLDYYWSAFAGAGTNSSSSSLANSLGVSPSPSNALLGASPSAAAAGLRSRSATNLKEGSDRMLDAIPSLPTPRSADHAAAMSRTGSSGDGRVLDLNEGLRIGNAEVESLGGWSGESDYSIDEGHGTNHSRFNGLRAGSSVGSSAHSEGSLVEYQAVGLDHGAGRRGLLDPSTTASTPTDDMPGGEKWDVRASITSQTTQETFRPDEDPLEKTPVAPVFVERVDRDLQAPSEPLSYDRSPRRDYPTRLVAATKQTTPTRPAASPSASGYTPTSGRLPFTSPVEVYRTSVPGVDVTVPSPPQSAPAWKSQFYSVAVEPDGAVKGKGKRTTLPATTSISSGLLADAMLSPEKARAASPEKRRSREPSPGRSPEPPPRSTLRAAYSPRTSIDGTSPLNISPRPPPSKDLPTIINTPYSPDKRSPDSEAGPARPSRSPSRSPSLSTSATINELTDMLGGAIDAMGLTDPRDASPPTVQEPRKERANLHLGSLAPAAELGVEGPITPGSLPSRGASLADGSMPPPPNPRLEHARRMPSGLSLRGAAHQRALVAQPPTTIASLSQRPWPAAMLYGNIKPMKYAGDRAKAYARAINDLARAETGLREWCVASSSSSSALPSTRPPKSSAMAGLGVHASLHSTPSTLTVPYSTTHARSVSSSSEFPMRADSYAAREISQRAVDPADAPNSLPPNLPYPQLQAQYASGALSGMKTSQSMQSVSSFSSKRSFFGGIGKKSSSKKDSTSLGPPSGTTSSAGKKDVRGLPISAPSYTAASSPGRVTDPGTTRPSISAPMGPRGPRVGSFTPPPQTNPTLAYVDVPARASLDTGMSRMNSSPARASFDGGTMLVGRKGSLPPKQSPISHRGSMSGSPNPDELRAMGDILPHVSKGVLRAYLARYGDQMQAIGMYLEDEKKGKVLKG